MKKNNSTVHSTIKARPLDVFNYRDVNHQEIKRDLLDRLLLGLERKKINNENVWVFLFFWTEATQTQFYFSFAFKYLDEFFIISIFIIFFYFINIIFTIYSIFVPIFLTIPLFFCSAFNFFIYTISSFNPFPLKCSQLIFW